MQTLRFKSNIKCGGCIAAVTPHFQQLAGIEKWEVDLQSPDRIVTVQSTDDTTPAEIAEAAKTAGYQLEVVG